MILTKTTTGIVLQRFDSETGCCISQEFIAGDQIAWEDPKGDRIEDGQYGLDLEGLYWPPDMKQPE